MSLSRVARVPPNRGARIVRRAEGLRRKIEQSNRQDLATLVTCLAKVGAEHAMVPGAQLNRATCAFLASDWRQLSAYKEHWSSGGAELRSSLSKLVGENKISGIYEDLVTRSGEGIALGGISNNRQLHRARHREVTLLKTFLFYANRAARSREEFEALELDRQLDLAYPVPIPRSWRSPPRTVLSRPDGEALLILNAGYVYGARLRRGEPLRGIDCAGFACYSVEASQQLYTSGLELVFQAHRGTRAHEARPRLAAELGLETGAHDTPEMLQLLDELTPVGRRLEAATAGDVVVWRWGVGAKRAGHCSIYVQRCEDHRDCFLGVEANRTDDKLQEGVFVRHHSLAVNGKDTYVLRRTDVSDTTNAEPGGTIDES